MTENAPEFGRIAGHITCACGWRGWAFEGIAQIFAEHLERCPKQGVRFSARQWEVIEPSVGTNVPNVGTEPA